MNLSHLSDEELEEMIAVRDGYLVDWKSWKRDLLDQIVSYYEEQLRRWSERRHQEAA